jgi:acyl carrier protein
MNDNRERLIACFLAVFPGLKQTVISTASNTSLSAWDSIAQVTLLAAVEEEFGIQVDPEQMDQLTSFHAILSYLDDKSSGQAASLAEHL